MKLLLYVICVPFMVMPATIGYWYICSGAEPFKIPFQYWLVPFILLALIVVSND